MAKPSQARFDPPGPGTWALDPVHFPRPVTRYWAETHPEPFRRGVRDFTSFYGMLIDTLEMAYVNGFAYKPVRPVAPRAGSRALPARRGGVRRQALAGAASRVGRDDQAGVDRDAPRAAGGRSRRALRRGPRRLPDSLPRPPRRDDLPAHALHRRRRWFRPGTSSPMSGDWTGAPLGGAARSDARARRRCRPARRRELERLIAAVEADAERAGAADVRRRSRRGARRSCARSTASRQRPMSGYLDLVGYRLLDGFDISEPLRARAARRAAAGDPRRGRPRRARRPRTSTSGSPTSAARCPRSTGPSSTSCSARRG